MDYDKAIFLDADLYFYDNIDFLFNEEINFNFIPSYHLDTLKVDGASFIVKPTKDYFDSLLLNDSFNYSINDEEATVNILPNCIIFNKEFAEPRIIDNSILIENYHMPKYALHLPGQIKYWEYLTDEEIQNWKNYDKYKMREIGEELYNKSLEANKKS